MSIQPARGQLQQALNRQLLVNDPYLGEATSSDFRDTSPLWPGDRWSSIELLCTTHAEGRRLEEYRFTPADGHRSALPVVFMFDTAADGRSRAIVYSDHHLVGDRKPIHTPVPDIHPWKAETDVLCAYFKALNGNHLEQLLDIFEEDGYFRHSNDETFRGRDELRIDFTKMMGTNGIRIRYCRFTDDGKTCAVECYMPSGRPAVAVYERGRPGRLKSVRIYL